MGPDSCPSRVVMLIESFASPPSSLLIPFTFCIIISLVGQVGLAKKMVRERDWSGIFCRSIGQDPVFSRPLLNLLYPHRADIQTSSTAAAKGRDSCPSRVVRLIESFASPPTSLLIPFTFCIIIILVGQVGLAKKMVRERDWSGIMCRSIGKDPVFFSPFPTSPKLFVPAQVRWGCFKAAYGPDRRVFL
ncbi:hypothetical protein PoB_005176600 [Plakobranchus ocellatus]|uniref:Uncharacterized protein n=1 Tax=Plakobranchus ocellatus TaxID=259542 RepID=A0AAV4C1L7_9GAST|nr:hypothetical protein PoB_005176600 [Plakobranchus ocellatus]